MSGLSPLSGPSPLTSALAFTPSAAQKAGAPYFIDVTFSDDQGVTTTCGVFVSDINLRPTCDAGGGPDATLEVQCSGPEGAVIQLAGSASDPDDALADLEFLWAASDASVIFDDATLSDPVALFPIGDGEHLACAAWGPSPAEAATIVLLHEGLGCIRLWRDFPAQLAQLTGCGVFAYSRRGYGHSSPLVAALPISRMADEARQVLPRLLDAIAPERLILIGHSDGGTIAAHYLTSDTHAALKGCVLIPPHFYCEASNLVAIRATADAFERGRLGDKLAKYHDDADGAFHGWADTWLDPAFADWDMRDDEIPKWRHPVLFIQGRQDPYGSEGQAAAAGRARDAQIAWIDDCGHSPHLVQQARTLALIEAFVSARLGGIGDGG